MGIWNKYPFCADYSLYEANNRSPITHAGILPVSSHGRRCNLDVGADANYLGFIFFVLRPPQEIADSFSSLGQTPRWNSARHDRARLLPLPPPTPKNKGARQSGPLAPNTILTCCMKTSALNIHWGRVEGRNRESFMPFHHTLQRKTDED